MHAVVQPLHAFTACGGPALVLARGAATGGEAEDVSLALAATLGAREADGEAVRVVVLRVAHRDDAPWACRAAVWLAERGRRVVLRAAVVLGRELEAVARRWGCTVLLEIAHRRPEINAALLGPAADPAAHLLLHAQHLRRVGLEVAVHLAPLLPVVHESRDDTVALLRHIAAADIRDAHLTVGRLTRGRVEALRDVLRRVSRGGQTTSLLRAYGLDVTADDPFADVPLSGKRLTSLSMASLFHAVRMEAEAEGIRVDHCGCAAQCHLDPQLVPEYVPLLTPDLFADAG